MQRILGIDPALETTGYGVIECHANKIRVVDAGIIRCKRNQPMPRRLLELHTGIMEVIEETRPDCVAIEELYSHYERPTTAILMGHARGTLMLAAAQAGIELFPYAATKVKKALTGNGRAPKSQMQTAVQLQLGLPEIPEPPDVADALAMALTHRQHQLVEKNLRNATLDNSISTSSVNGK